MILKVPKKVVKNNSLAWLMYTRKLLPLMVLQVYTEVLLFHVLVLLSTEVFISVFMTQLSQSFPNKPEITYSLTSYLDGVSLSVLVLLHILLILSEEEWWWHQEKEKNSQDLLIAEERSYKKKDGNHYLKEQVLIFWEVLQEQVSWHFMTDSSYWYSEKNSDLESEMFKDISKYFKY